MIARSSQNSLVRNLPGRIVHRLSRYMEHRGFRALILLLVLSPLSNDRAVARSSQVAEELSQLTKDLAANLVQIQREDGFPGATLGFVLPDGHVGSTAVGLADKERNIPMRPGDRMLSGSIGKTYVAALALRLVEEGRASLDTRISQWLGKESWFHHLPNGDSITLRMLLNHSSGLRNHVNDERFVARARKNPDAFWAHEELVEYDLYKPPLFPAGKGFAYADTNYILVGLIVEKITGKSYYSELAEEILNPLELSSTSPSDRRVIPGIVNAYTDPQNEFGLPVKVCASEKDALNPQIEWTGGGLVSTAPDLARWAWLLLGGHVLKNASLRQMLTGIPAASEGGRYGLGMAIRDTELGPAYGHDGEFPGFLSVMAYFPRYQIAVAVQLNTDDDQRFKIRLADMAIRLAKVMVTETRETHSLK